MNTIFISYAREDRAHAKALAQALESQGWPVWWDAAIPSGRTFDEVIDEALAAAACVVVLWSKWSVESRYVRGEAEDGAERGILIPALIERDIRIPRAFRSIHAADLVGWDGSATAPSFLQLRADLGRLLGPPPIMAHRPSMGIGTASAATIQEERAESAADDGNDISRTATATTNSLVNAYTPTVNSPTPPAGIPSPFTGLRPTGAVLRSDRSTEAVQPMPRDRAWLSGRWRPVVITGLLYAAFSWTLHLVATEPITAQGSRSVGFLVTAAWNRHYPFHVYSQFVHAVGRSFSTAMVAAVAVVIATMFGLRRGPAVARRRLVTSSLLNAVLETAVCLQLMAIFVEVSWQLEYLLRDVLRLWWELTFSVSMVGVGGWVGVRLANWHAIRLARPPEESLPARASRGVEQLLPARGRKLIAVTAGLQLLGWTAASLTYAFGFMMLDDIQRTSSGGVSSLDSFVRWLFVASLVLASLCLVAGVRRCGRRLYDQSRIVAVLVSVATMLPGLWVVDLAIAPDMATYSDRALGFATPGYLLTISIALALLCLRFPSKDSAR